MCEDFGDFTETVKTKNVYNATKIMYVNPQNGENQRVTSSWFRRLR